MDTRGYLAGLGAFMTSPRLQFGIRVAVLQLVLLLLAAPPAAAQDEILVVRSADSATVAQKPWLVVFVFDKSGSMLGPCREDPSGARRRSWDVVTEDAEKKLAQLQSTLGSFDLRMYAFGSRAAEFSRPIEGRNFSIADAGDVQRLRQDIRRMSDPRNGEGTNLWNSLGSIFAGLGESAGMSAYAGAVVVVFSDGADSLQPTDQDRRLSEGRKTTMLSALEAARQAVDIRLSVLPIGAWLQDPTQLEALRSIATLSELGVAVDVPVVVSYAITPSTLGTEPLTEAGASVDVRYRLEGFTPAGASRMRIALRDASPGLSLQRGRSDPQGGRLRLSTDRSLEGGATGRIEFTFFDDEELESRNIRLAVPPFEKVAPIEAWGLPEGCADLGGRRAIVLGAGQALDLAVAAPSSARVTWSVDGRVASNTPRLQVSDLPPGRHAVRVEIATSDDSEAADLDVFVVDRTVTLRGPEEVRAGDPATFEAELSGLPPMLESRLGPATWTIQGRDEQAGDAVTTRFDRRGTERIAFSRTLELCGERFDFTASTVLSVTPGPAIRLLGGEIVRGRESRIEAAMSGETDISRVVFEIDGVQKEANIDAADADGPAIAWIRHRADDGDPVPVRATPILKDDRGLDRAIDDPECATRAQTRVYSVVEPDVRIAVESPRTGIEVAYGTPIDVRVRLEGEDAEVVERVVVRVRPGSGTASELVLTAGTDWSAGVTPSVSMGGSLDLVAQAYEASAEIGEPVSVAVTLVAPQPELIVTGAASTGTVTWTGRNENPPPVTVAVVSRGTDRPYPMMELRSLEWSVRGNGLEVESKSESDATAAFAIKRAGPETIRAVVSTADGRTRDLATEVVARPEPVVPGPKLASRRVVGTSAVEVDHADTKGAWSDYRVRGRIGDGEWMPLTEESFDTAVASATPAEVEVWYRPWGADDYETPWDGRGGWVRSAPMPLELLKPHSPLWIAVALLASLFLAVLSWRLLVGHMYWGATAMWTTDGSEDPPRGSYSPRLPIRWWGGGRRPRYRLWAKEAEVPIATRAGIHDLHHGWVRRVLRKSGRRHPRVRFGASGSHARYIDSSGLTNRTAARSTASSSSLIVFDPPGSELGRLGADSAERSRIERNARPIFLRVELSRGRLFRNLFLPWVLLPLCWIAIGVLFAVLYSQRVI
jgi:hypothetical protein